MLLAEFRRAGYRESTIWRNYMPDIRTIEKYYAHVDTEDKRKAIEAALGGGVIEKLDSAPYTVDDEELLRKLYGL